MAIAVLLLLGQSLAPDAIAQGIQVGRIIAVDTVSMDFLCQTNNTIRQYWITRATRFLTRGPRASFFDLRTGQRVQVVSHDAGKLAIADLVTS